MQVRTPWSQGEAALGGHPQTNTEVASTASVNMTFVSWSANPAERGTTRADEHLLEHADRDPQHVPAGRALCPAGRMMP